MTRDARLKALGSRVAERIETFFHGISVSPSLLHGDLWSGNMGSTAQGPCVFDPACYYGHSEAEFGMSWCAGFGPDFWKVLEALRPRARTARARWLRFG